jgi:hypothetical protein
MSDTSASLLIGWSEVDITPPNLPVILAGQFHARVSDGVISPLKASICAMENGDEQVIFVCCDVVSIAEEPIRQLRQKLAALHNEIQLEKVIVHVTHSHTAPTIYRGESSGTSDTLPQSSAFKSASEVPEYGVELPIQTTTIEYTDWLTDQLAQAIVSAWDTRKAGGVAYGQDYAVVGRNRRWVDKNGNSYMYNLLARENKEIFRHIEGYEDHSINLLATYDDKDQLTGLIVNIASTSQEVEGLYQVSADFWHETRAELRKRFGQHIFILPQVSAAGDQTSHLIFETAAHQRMLKLRGHNALQEIALRISDSVGRILPVIKKEITRNPLLQHRIDIVQLTMNALTQKDADDAIREADLYQKRYEEELKKLEEDPSLKQSDPLWYVPVTIAWRRKNWHLGVAERFEAMKKQAYLPTEVHVIRLGDIAFATNRFELYTDFGIQIKVRSPAIQTFLVQLACGGGSYLPSPRSVQGGGYGSVPASNIVGPQAGQELVEHTIKVLRELFPS